MSTVTLSDETQALLDEQMKRGDFASTDEVLRIALQKLAADTDGVVYYEDLDVETRALIEEADAWVSPRPRAALERGPR